MCILDKIAGLKILVVGDVMLDRYWWGSVNRISPEAPVPIVELQKMSVVAGGAANVAANLAGLGVKPILVGIKGDDPESELVSDVLEAADIFDHHIFQLKGRKTTTKTRIVAHSQHVVRIDQESAEPISQRESVTILDRLPELLKNADAVIVSDYAKGLLSEELLSSLIKLVQAENKILVVDPKGRDFLKYRGATAITPNKKEAADASAIALSDPDLVGRAGKWLIEKLELKALLITESENGMTVFTGPNDSHHFETMARDVYDVTGAGDTVIATFTAALAAGSNFVDAAKLANAAAGIVVGHIGTTKITRLDLSEFLNQSHSK